MTDNNNKATLVKETDLYSIYACNERGAYIVLNKDYGIEELECQELPKAFVYVNTAESIVVADKEQSAGLVEPNYMN